MLPNYTFRISPSDANFDSASLTKVPGYLATEFGSEVYGNPATPLDSCMWGLSHSNDTGTFRIKNLDIAGSVDHSIVSGIFNVIDASFCFDTNMRPIIGWRHANDACRLRYFDPSPSDYVIMNLPDSKVTPACFLDIKNPILVIAGFPDALCFHLSEDMLQIVVRVQREKFQTIHPCFTVEIEGESPCIVKVGKSRENRIKLALREVRFISSP